ncbi:hypothetical protein [Planococcus sp. ISL-109]|uniref:hypothetical protein n=1 Tax=Planococcus sp. ISL-109 TaxID=2819166 RepID=UPI001BEC1A89|nr:hypothetical protein [Planococcus sp. ISL-109]MBT2582602.1 hypothetical protein [Planococcus sp. ISL-109]
MAGAIEENEVLTFKIALMQNQYQVMIENSDICFNERRAKKVVEAFVLTNQSKALGTLIDAKKKENLKKNVDILTKESEQIKARANEIEEFIKGS